MTDLGATVLCCTPSYAAYLGESIHERGVSDMIHLKAGIFGAEGREKHEQSMCSQQDTNMEYIKLLAGWLKDMSCEH